MRWYGLVGVTGGVRACVALFLVASAGGCGGGGEPASPDASTGPCSLSDACLGEELTTLCTQTFALGGVLVVRTPEARYHATCGFADVAQTRAVVLGDRFRVGSITKTFTAALALQLVDTGELRLDTTPADAGLAIDNADVITLRDMLGHTAGLVEYNSEPSFDWTRNWTIEEVIDWVTANFEPKYAPRAGFTYSGTGFQVAAAMIGADGRAPYADALRARLLGPLHLDNTYLDGAETLPGGKVEGSELSGITPVPRSIVDDWASADGSLATTADDLVTWAEHLFVTRDVLSEASLAAMTTPVVLDDGSTPTFLGAHYGLGLEIEDAPDGTIYSHGGMDFGYVAYVGVQPATGRAVAVVLNTQSVNPRTFARLGWDVLRR